MTKFTRRAAIGSGMSAFAVGAAALALPAQAAVSLGMPTKPMRLGRRIERGLRGGASLTVTREWQVSFTSQGRGIIIGGQQTFAKVDAPVELAPVAAIEEARSTDNMFPIMLSGLGEILTVGEFTAQSDLEAAVKEAENIIKRSGGSATDRARKVSYLAQLQQASSTMLEQMPRDLFYPSEEALHSIRPVNLPDGSEGEFEFTYAARRAPGKSWLEHAERQIVTRIGSDERRSSEVWSLAV